MASLNRVWIMGNLGKDPELRQTLVILYLV